MLDLRTPPFAHGHFYVALSRVRKFSDIAIFTNDDMSAMESLRQKILYTLSSLSNEQLYIFLMTSNEIL